MKVDVWESVRYTGNIVILDIIVVAETKTLVMTAVLAEIQHE